jgi:hypothetical protein
MALSDFAQDPGEYFIISFLALAAFSWNYLYLPDESLGNVLLFLISCNFVLSVLHLSFSSTCWIFFGDKSPKLFQMKVFEMILSFLMSKIVILELASQESGMDGWHWAFWLILISWAKGLTYHANFYVYYISQCGESHWSRSLFAFFHLVPVLVCVLIALIIGNMWTEKSPSNNLIILLCYDLLILIVESGQVICRFVLHMTESVSDSSALLEIICDVILTTMSLLHLIHIITINGISVTLVGVVTIVNFYSVSTKLLTHSHQLREFFRIKNKVQQLFPTILLTDSFPLSSWVCPICLQGYQSNATMKQLPCSHGIHESCLRTLLQKHTTQPPGREDLLPNHSQVSEGSDFHIFRCPICRQSINVETAELVEVTVQRASPEETSPDHQTLRDEQQTETNKSPDVSSQPIAEDQGPTQLPGSDQQIVMSRASLVWTIIDKVFTFLFFGRSRASLDLPLPVPPSHRPTDGNLRKEVTDSLSSPLSPLISS